MKVPDRVPFALDDPSCITLASNNGEIGGGEVMLLALAEELTALGMFVTILGPSRPGGLIEESKDRGFDTVVMKARTRVHYMLALRKWDRSHRDGLLWCNGLLPAVATAGHRGRLVHLHQRPRRNQKSLARIATWRSLATLVPSADMATVIRGATVLHNWVAGLRVATSRTPSNAEGAIRIGFLGRPSAEKGVKTLIEAIRILDEATPGRYRLVLGGESRFVGKASRNAVEAALWGLGELVERTGWIAPEDFFRRIDILVCPSLWPESFGLVVAESMSARIPVVVSDAGALPEVVGPDHPWIARAGDAADLAKVVRRAAESDTVPVESAFLRWKCLFSPEAGRHRLRLLLIDLGCPPPTLRKSDHE